MRPILSAGLALGLLLSLAPLDARSEPADPDPSSYFSAEQIARGKAYRFENRVVYLANLALRVGTLVLLLTTPAGDALRNLALRASGRRRWPGVLLFCASVLVLLSILSLPLSLYSGFYHEHAYGLSTERLSGWWAEYAKSVAVNIALFAPVGLCLWALVGRYPARWWLPAWAGAGVGTLLLVFAAPVAIDPLFYDFRPVRDEAFRERALRLADRAGIRVDEILEMDASRRTRRVNAYFTGLGGTRRIVVYDNLLRESTPDEAALVLAHEMGHWRHDHIWKGIGLGLLGSLVVLLVSWWTVRRACAGRWGRLRGPEDPLVLVVILLVVTVLNFASLPLQNGISRSFERQADMASLQLTGLPEVFVSVEKKLAVRNLADVSPSRPSYHFFYTHPPVMERIRMGLRYREANRNGDFGW